MKTSVLAFPARCAVLLLAVVATALAANPPLPPSSPMPDSLDLKSAIGFAIDNNFTIRQARERIRQQEGVVIEITAREIPNVAATAYYEHLDKKLSSSFPPSDKSWAINLTATQTLFAGGGVRSAVKSADLTREAALLDLKAVINEALLAVRISFFDVLLNREKIKVQEQNVALLREQLKNVTDRFNAGTVSSFEKLRAEVAVANAQVPLITARNDFRLAIESLRLALGFTSINQGLSPRCRTSSARSSTPP